MALKSMTVFLNNISLSLKLVIRSTGVNNVIFHMFYKIASNPALIQKMTLKANDL